MDLQERVRLLAQRLEELAEEKRLIEEEIGEAVEFALPEELTQEFIDYYYWETQFPIDSLSKALTRPAVKAATPGKTIELPCVICGKPLLYKADSRNKRHELIAEHRKRSRNHRRSNYNDFICPECIKAHELEVKRSKEHKQDKAAQRRIKQYGGNLDLANIPYDLFLQTIYWKRFASYARKEAGYACQECGATGYALHVHHLTYERRGRERLSDVKVLCKSCHEKIHGRKFN